MASLAAKAVAEEVLETLGKGKRPNIEKIAIKNGYSVTSAHAGVPQQTKTFQDIIAKALSDDKLSKLHEKFLKKQEFAIISDGAQNGSHIEYTGQPHPDALKALDIAYKLKGKYPTDGEGGNKTLIINITGETAQRYGLLKSNPEDR